MSTDYHIILILLLISIFIVAPQASSFKIYRLEIKAIYLVSNDMVCATSILAEIIQETAL